MTDNKSNEYLIISAINKIQEIINIVNKFDCKTITDIANHSNKSPTNIRKTYHNIKENIYKDNEQIKINCSKAEETIYIKKITSAIYKIIEKPELLLYQEKYLTEILNLTSSETKAVKTYIIDIKTKTPNLFPKSFRC